MGILGAIPQPTTGCQLPATWVLARPSPLLECLHSPGSAGEPLPPQHPQTPSFVKPPSGHMAGPSPGHGCTSHSLALAPSARGPAQARTGDRPTGPPWASTQIALPSPPCGADPVALGTPAPSQARALAVPDRQRWALRGLGRCWGPGLGPGQVMEGAPWGCVWAERDPGVPATLGSHWTPSSSFPWLLQRPPMGRVTGLAWGGSRP